jgi:CelD/BcsL family acetyltransferase involved in cellulose biosynthesis
MIDAWARFQTSATSEASPYLSAGFARMVADVSRSTRVVVACFDDGVSGPVGFLPLSFGRSDIARPLAPGIANAAGIVHASEPYFDWAEARVLLSRRVGAWRYDRVFAEQAQSLGLAPATTHTLAVADFTAGWESYHDWLSTTHPKWLKSTRSGRRRLAVARGEVCFTYVDSDPAALLWLIRTKREQCHSRGWKDVYSNGFTREFMERSLSGEVDGIAGVLSTLRCDGDVVAAAFGVVSPRVHSGSVLAQDPMLGQYSLGRLCLLELSSAAAKAGRERHDLGEGQESFKEKFANVQAQLASGTLGGRGALGKVSGLMSWGSGRLSTFSKQHPILEVRVRHTAHQLRRLQYAVDPRVREP